MSLNRFVQPDSHGKIFICSFKKYICLTAILTINNLMLKSLVIVRFLNVYYLSSYKASNSKFMNTIIFHTVTKYSTSIV